MAFTTQELLKAYVAYQNFRSSRPRPHHERYIFPFFAGSYFTYRKIDIIRIAAIANSLSDNPSYIDVGCGYGDFLKKIREFIPNAIGIEKDCSIFYIFRIAKPDFIYSTPVEQLDKKTFDIAFVGWMEPGVDFRRYVASFARCIITTFDAGGQCGVSGGCEYEEFGLEKIAWWRTPSWIDINSELMNRFYTPSLTENNGKKKEDLAAFRTAHNLWYVYARPDTTDKVISALKLHLEREEQLFMRERFEFEILLDECGFHYKEELPFLLSKEKQLWKVSFD
jgi:SAM-dependent methyltransferase